MNDFDRNLWNRGVSQEDRNIALLAHLIVFFSTFLGPLVIYLVKKDSSKFVAFHAMQALLFQAALVVMWLVSVALCLVLIGFPLLFVVGLLHIIIPIIGAVKANNGEWYELPIIGGMARSIVGA